MSPPPVDGIDFTRAMGLEALVAGAVALITGLSAIKSAILVFVTAPLILVTIEAVRDGVDPELLPFLFAISAIGMIGGLPGAAAGGFLRRIILSRTG